MAARKSAEAFRTISEAADELDVPQHVLRHWEEVFGQVRPMRRAGGRRYYRPVDIDVLRGVRALLHDHKYTTKGVQQIFKDNGVKYVAEIGRHKAAGKPIDLHPNVAGGKVAAGSEQNANTPGTASTLTDNSMHPENASGDVPHAHTARGITRDATAQRLVELLTRLESIETSLDEAALALEAIEKHQD